MPIRTIIIDDEPSSINALLWEIESLDQFELEIVETCTSPVAGIEAINQHRPDLLLLDVEMPHINGIELLKQVENTSFHVVFTTAYDQYALEAFRLNAVDYLLKPVERAALEQALLRYQNKKEGENIGDKLEKLYQQLRSRDLAFQKIALPTLEGLEFVKIRDIVRCESESNYTTLYFSSGRRLVVCRTLREVEGMINSAQFFRVHKSHLVNIEFIERYIRGKDGHLVLESGEVIPVSRNKKDDFFSQF